MRSYRFEPAGTAWYRLVPDKIFSPHKETVKKDARPHPASPPRRGGRFPAKVRFVRNLWRKTAQRVALATKIQLAPTIVGGYLLKRALSGRRWDYAGAYAGLSGTKTGRFPHIPAYSRVMTFAIFSVRQKIRLSKERAETRRLVSYEVEAESGG
jgi:hypothetical protein